jgi:hypothetical protein
VNIFNPDVEQVCATNKQKKLPRLHHGELPVLAKRFKNMQKFVKKSKLLRKS